MAESRVLIGLAEVQDMHQRATGRRPSEMTLRSYNSRGKMPKSVTRGKWDRQEIIAWIREQRPRPTDDVVTQRQDAIRKAVASGSTYRVDVSVRTAKRRGLTWVQIAQALPVGPDQRVVSRQAVQERFGHLMAAAEDDSQAG
jgi:hypothetical protein